MNFTKLDNGLITFKGKLVAYVRGSTILILTNARTGFGAEDHVAFDKMVYDAGKALDRQYVENFREYFNPKARFYAFLEGTALEGVSLTAEEKGLTALKARVVELETSILAKITDVYKMPTLPYVTAAAINVEKIYSSQAQRAERWLKGEISFEDYNLWQIARYSQSTATLLRVHETKGGNAWVQGTNQAKMPEKRAIAFYKELVEFWTDPLKPNKKLFKSYGGHAVSANQTAFTVGCKSFPRAEIERIAVLRNWPTS